MNTIEKQEFEVPSEVVQGTMTKVNKFPFKSLCGVCDNFIDVVIVHSQTDALERRVSCSAIPGVFNGLEPTAYTDFEGKPQEFPNIQICNKFNESEL